MNQRESSFFYRGVLLLLFGAIAVERLSSTDQPWARSFSTIAGVVWILGAGALIIFVTFRRSRQFRPFLDAPARDETLPPGLYLDGWYRLARLAVAASVLLAVILAAMLLLVEPPRQCPSWHLPDGRSTPLWSLFFMWTVPLLAVLSFMVVRWRWFVRKAIESADGPITTPVTYVLFMTVIVGCGMSQLPWALAVTKCWPGS